MKTVLSVVSVVLASVLASCHEDKKAPPPPSATAADPVTAPASAPASAPAAAAPGSSSNAPSAAAPPDAPAAIAAQHVLVAFKGAQNAPKTITRSKAEAKKRAEEVSAKAKAGSDFTALVSEYSDDPASKDRMGSLGKFTRDKMVKPFSDAAFALAVGEVSGPVETPFGFHVIKRNQ